ncbi:MAG: M28 family peptidase [bacterium]
MKTIYILAIVVVMSLTINQKTSAQTGDDMVSQLKSHITFLSSTEMQGRFPGTPENKKAGEYIAGKFKESGLETIGDSYFKPFKYIDTLAIGPSSAVSFDVLIRKPGVPENMLRSRTKTWTSGKDWIPMRFSKNGTAKGEVVFCGYGVTAKESGYDDYEGIDVNGKIVIVLADSSEGLPLDDFWTPYSDLSYKADNALKHGAAAIVFVKVLHDSANVFYDFDVDRKYKSEIVALHANRTLMSEFFTKQEPLLKVEKEINTTKKPKSFVLPDIKMSITVDVEEVQKELNNVVGLVKGTDPDFENEYIVVGANFDGLGAYWETPKWRPKVWTVLNSADFNASGSAALIELAKLVKQNPLKRPVLFVGFNASVTGQDGSKAFISNPPVSAEKMILMINLNTIGKLRNDRLSIIGSGTGANFSQNLNSAKSQDSTLMLIPGHHSFCKSDHLPFYSSDIPVLMFTTGLHTDLWKPSDTQEKINYSEIPRVIYFANNLIQDIGNSGLRPSFFPDPSITEYKDAKRGYDCWLGIMPDYEINQKGLVIADIFRNSPASKSNLKAGDVICKVNGKEIKNYFDLETALSLTKPGDSIQLLIVRDNAEKTINVKAEKHKK